MLWILLPKYDDMRILEVPVAIFHDFLTIYEKKLEKTTTRLFLNDKEN